ncbi:MAG: hypothetical protein AAGI44_06060, partial [Pseudomonadota bacterium]
FAIGTDEAKFIHTFCANGAKGHETILCEPEQTGSGGCWAPSFSEGPPPYWDCQCQGGTGFLPSDGNILVTVQITCP